MVGKPNFLKTIEWKKPSVWLLGLLMLFSLLVRVIGLGSLPDGTYTDEAYGAYLAYGLMSEGVDDYGYAYPVYFTAWGSGMNALYIYLGALFFRLFGVSLLVYRLPQVLVGVLAIYAMFVICKHLFDERFAFLAAFVLAINPWHIMMCRFGLESNLAPNLFLVGLMFLVLGIKKKEVYFLPAAGMFGLTLYAYAITWLFVPLFLVLCAGVLYRYMPQKKVLISFAGILFVLALPLFLFLAVNFGLMPEIKTAVFSIPKLTGFRGGELGGGNIKDGLFKLFSIVVANQSDGRVLLSCEVTGSYYYFTTPFMIFGVICHIVCLIRNWKQTKKADLSVVMLLWLLCAGLISVINSSLTMIHINMIHIPVVFYGAYGVWQMAGYLKQKVLLYACVAIWVCSFGFFVNTYMTFGFPDFFSNEPYEAVEAARTYIKEGEQLTIVGFDATYKYPNLMWQEKWNIRDYAEKKQMDGDLFFANLLSYKDIRYVDENLGDDVVPDGVYVLKTYQTGDFRKHGFEIVYVNDQYALAIPKIF